MGAAKKHVSKVGVQIVRPLSILGRVYWVFANIVWCSTSENYITEKLTLLKPNKDNPTGFLVKALKEDWTGSQTSTSPPAKVAEDTVAKRKEAEKQVKMLERHIEKLTKEKNEIEVSIIDSLLHNELILQKAYDTVLRDIRPFFKTHIAQILHLPIKEQYKGSVFIAQGINLKCIKFYPEKFAEVHVWERQIAELR